jgi:hypothetical protein
LHDLHRTLNYHRSSLQLSGRVYDAEPAAKSARRISGPIGSRGAPGRCECRRSDRLLARRPNLVFADVRRALHPWHERAGGRPHGFSCCTTRGISAATFYLRTPVEGYQGTALPAAEPTRQPRGGCMRFNGIRFPRRTGHDSGVRAARGAVTGILLSLPLWAGAILLVWVVLD